MAKAKRKNGGIDLKFGAKIKRKLKRQLKEQINEYIDDYPIIKKTAIDISTICSEANLKQVILLRKDLKLPPGKAAAQAAHAAVEAVQKSNPVLVKKWRSQGAKKIVLKVNGIDEIYKCSNSAENRGLTTAIITDAGKTVIAPGTVTCCAIGPDDEKAIDKITGHLKMY